MSPNCITPTFRATLRDGDLIIRGRVGVNENHDGPFLKPLAESGDTLPFEIGYREFHQSTHAIPERQEIFEYRVGPVSPHIRRLLIKLCNDQEFVIDRTS